MVCDMLRSCYSTKARLHADRSKLTTIEWYFAPDGALPLPFTSAVMSDNWLPEEEVEAKALGTTLGEVPGHSRPWRAGAAPASVTGQAPCGLPDWWANGTPADMVFPRAADGPLLECFVPQPAGLDTTGQGNWAHFPALPRHEVGCGPSTYSLPGRFRVRITNKSGPDAVLFPDEIMAEWQSGSAVHARYKLCHSIDGTNLIWLVFDVGCDGSDLVLNPGTFGYPATSLDPIRFDRPGFFWPHSYNFAGTGCPLTPPFSSGFYDMGCDLVIEEFP